MRLVQRVVSAGRFKHSFALAVVMARQELLLTDGSGVLAGVGRLSAAAEVPAGAIETIDRRIKNMNIKLDNETVTQAEFKAELESLRRQRRIYEAQLGEQPNPKELEGLAARWRKGDEQDRHELLTALFEKLHVANGQIFGCTPRGDRVNRVQVLIGTAMGEGDDDGPGAATLRNVERRGRDLNSRWASDP